MGDMNCEGCDCKDECQELPACVVEAYEQGQKDEYKKLKKAFFRLYPKSDAWNWIELEARLGGNND